MANINNAISWAVDICNASNVGYSQDYRNAQTVNGVTYYDCSSFIWYALKNGGFDVETAHGSSYPFTTSDMRACLLKLGFEKLSVESSWKPRRYCLENWTLRNGLFRTPNNGGAYGRRGSC